MRIVRVANFITPRSGGLRTALRELGAGYAAAGHEPVLVMPGGADRDERTAQGRVITLRGPVVPLTGGYRMLLSRRRVRGILESLRPDRLEVSDRTTLRWTGRWASRHGVPAVMVSHESVAGLLSLPLTEGQGLARLVTGGLARFLADTLNARTARDYTQVVCTTQWAAAEFERLGVANLRRVPLGVDLALFSPLRHCLALRQRYAGPDEVLLVHCGRLSPEKRPQRSLDALARLRALGVPAVLVVAGDGPLRTRLERQAARGGLPAHFTGFLPAPEAVARLLATADVVIAPGPVETFGLAALEALACGTPVVVSGSSALPEVVGAAGVAVAGEDFAAGVLGVLRQPAAGRRAAARARAEQFGWPAAVRGFLAAHAAGPAGTGAAGTGDAGTAGADTAGRASR
ncbi:MAG TPA: glycosyltransferase [Streptosporangiaceae bacterium]|nr:glycosyltransferase [Streptosporangiaceae bacterium]